MNLKDSSSMSPSSEGIAFTLKVDLNVRVGTGLMPLKYSDNYYQHLPWVPEPDWAREQ